MDATIKHPNDSSKSKTLGSDFPESNCSRVLPDKVTSDNSSEESEDGVRLKRVLGLPHGVAIIAGLVIGGGIYITPKSVLVYSQSPGLCLILWGVGGILSMLGALTYAEMGVMMPMSGEKYAYLDIMFGPFVAFLYLWTYLFLMRTGANAIKCIMFARYVLKPFFPDCDIPETAILLLGTLLACLLTFVNCISVKMAARGQMMTTFISLFSLFLIAASGFVWTLRGNENNVENYFEGSTTNAGNWALAIHSTVFSYYGWTALNFLIEELKCPERNLPLSIIISISLTTVLYVLVNWTYVAVLGSKGIIASQAVAVSAALKTMGPLAYTMPILIAIAAVSSFNSGMMVGSRLAFAGARRGHFPMVLSLISVRYSTPMASLLLQLIIIVPMMWTFDLYTIIANAAFFMLSFDVVCVAGFIRMRVREERDAKRTIKLPLVIPVLYLLIVTLLVVVPIVTNTRETLTWLVVGLCSAVPYYLVVVVWTNKPKALNIDRFSNFIQRLLISVPEEIKKI